MSSRFVEIPDRKLTSRTLQRSFGCQRTPICGLPVTVYLLYRPGSCPRRPTETASSTLLGLCLDRASPSSPHTASLLAIPPQRTLHTCTRDSRRLPVPLVRKRDDHCSGDHRSFAGRARHKKACDAGIEISKGGIHIDSRRAR